MSYNYIVLEHFIFLRKPYRTSFVISFAFFLVSKTIIEKRKDFSMEVKSPEMLVDITIVRK